MCVVYLCVLLFRVVGWCGLFLPIVSVVVFGVVSVGGVVVGVVSVFVGCLLPVVCGLLYVVVWCCRSLRIVDSVLYVTLWRSCLLVFGMWCWLFVVCCLSLFDVVFVRRVGVVGVFVVGVVWCSFTVRRVVSVTCRMLFGWRVLCDRRLVMCVVVVCWLPSIVGVSVVVCCLLMFGDVCCVLLCVLDLCCALCVGSWSVVVYCCLFCDVCVGRLLVGVACLFCVGLYCSLYVVVCCWLFCGVVGCGCLFCVCDVGCCLCVFVCWLLCVVVC